MEDWKEKVRMGVLLIHHRVETAENDANDIIKVIEGVIEQVEKEAREDERKKTLKEVSIKLDNLSPFFLERDAELRKYRANLISELGKKNDTTK